MLCLTLHLLLVHLDHEDEKWIPWESSLQTGIHVSTSMLGPSWPNDESQCGHSYRDTDDGWFLIRKSWWQNARFPNITILLGTSWFICTGYNFNGFPFDWLRQSARRAVTNDDGKKWHVCPKGAKSQSEFKIVDTEGKENMAYMEQSWASLELGGGGTQWETSRCMTQWDTSAVANHGAKVPPISWNMGPHTANHIVKSTLNSIPNTLKQ